MVVDARPTPDGVSYDGTTGFWRPRIQLRDAAFSLSPTRAQSIYFRDYDTDPEIGWGTSRLPSRPPLLQVGTASSGTSLVTA